MLKKSSSLINNKKEKDLKYRQVQVQVQEGDTSEILLKEICQIIYSLYRAKEITKKVYSNIMNSIKVIIQNGYYIYEF